MSRELDLQPRACVTRRHFLKASACGIGMAALGGLLNPHLSAGVHFPARAKRVIYLFMSGGPSHVDTFDPKPALERYDGQPIPPSLVKDVHFAMIKDASNPLLKASPFRFSHHGQSGNMMSDLFPHLGGVADELAIIRSMHSEVFNHDPAVSLLNSGDSRVGRPTMGAWASYGLGSDTKDLPAYIVLTSGVKRQPLLNSYWTNGFLPSKYQGVRFREQGDPILFLSNPDGINPSERGEQLALIRWMNEQRFELFRDPETLARIQQYETAFRMQVSAPELMDMHDEPQSMLDLYGCKPGVRSFAANCLLARRLVERDVRFVQLYDMGWDSHDNMERDHARQCRSVDRACAALIQDLKQRGLLDETLVIWGGEFGRTPVVQGGGKAWGRDHHPHGFSMWMAGGGMKGGITHGATDDFGFHAVERKVSVHDFHATALHCLGINHKQLTYRHQGRDFRLTDVAGNVLQDLLV
jgi:hypothetical protein